MPTKLPDSSPQPPVAVPGLEIALEDARWQAAGLPPLAAGAIAAVLQSFDLDPTLCEVSLLACDDTRIADLNRDFRDKPQPTNVLAWPSEELASDEPEGDPHRPEPGPDGMIELGDIALSFDTCAVEAAAADKPLSDHATHLIVHGMLHLLGYDHQTDAQAHQMETLEIKILGKMGVPDPY